MNETEARELAQHLDIGAHTVSQCSGARRHAPLEAPILARWNEKINLTALANTDDISDFAGAENLITLDLEAGFTLAEITQLLAEDTTPSATRQWRDMATRKLPELDRHIAQIATGRGIAPRVTI